MKEPWNNSRAYKSYITRTIFFKSFHKGGSIEKGSKDDSSKLNARIENGDEKYLQNVRKKIISELKDKESTKNKKDKHHKNERRSFHHENDSFKRFSNKMRPPPLPHNSHFRRSNDRKFQRNSFHDRREKWVI